MKRNHIIYIDHQNNKSKKSFRLRILTKENDEYKLILTKYFKTFDEANEFKKFTQKLLIKLNS